MLKVEKYEDCIAELKSKSRNLSLLLGNGFSIAYDNKIFSYNALQTFISDLKDPVIDKLFKITRSKNLEVIMQQLRVLSELLISFGDATELTQKIEEADSKLRKGLIDAVKALHPGHVFTVPDQRIIACHEFLKPYLSKSGAIFTTNYDILLYWVLMRSGSPNAIDGFGYERDNPEETNPDDFIYSSELTWGPNMSQQNVHYLHGALHIFDRGVDIEKEKYSGGEYLLNCIKERMDREEYPLFVTAGDGNDKLEQILHNRYLSYCFESLKKINGSLIVFGFQFGSYDHHIIDAINEAALYGRGASNKLHSVYIGVYSETDANYIRSIQGKFKCKVRLFDSSLVNVWR